MENKNRFYNALKKNKGRINEIDLGEKMGLDEDETRAVIAQLLSEHRIDYVENIACSYRVQNQRVRNTKPRNNGRQTERYCQFERINGEEEKIKLLTKG